MLKSVPKQRRSSLPPQKSAALLPHRLSRHKNPPHFCLLPHRLHRLDRYPPILIFIYHHQYPSPSVTHHSSPWPRHQLPPLPPRQPRPKRPQRQLPSRPSSPPKCQTLLRKRKPRRRRRRPRPRPRPRPWVGRKSSLKHANKYVVFMLVFQFIVVMSIFFSEYCYNY